MGIGAPRIRAREVRWIKRDQPPPGAHSPNSQAWGTNSVIRESMSCTDRIEPSAGRALPATTIRLERVAQTWKLRGATGVRDLVAEADRPSQMCHWAEAR